MQKNLSLATSKEIKAELQKRYCKKRGIPNFAGDGRCYGCGRNVFDGYTDEECANDLVTGCRFCHTSMCE